MTSVALAAERICLGMDVSRDKIAVAVLRPGQDVPAVEVIGSHFRWAGANGPAYSNTADAPVSIVRVELKSKPASKSKAAPNAN